MRMQPLASQLRPAVDRRAEWFAAPSPPTALPSFDMIVVEYQTRIARYLLQMVGDEDLALDLTQDTFVSAYRHLDALRSPLALSSWLYRIATNLAIQARRKRCRFALQSLAVLELSGMPCVDAPDQAVLEQQAVRHALGRLPKDHAACLLLHCHEGFSYQEVAEILDSTAEAVRKRVARAKQQFRTQYEVLMGERRVVR